MSTTYTPTDAKRATALEFDDGDAPQASKINPLAEAAFDTATYAANRAGTHRVIAIQSLLDGGTSQKGSDFTSSSFGGNDIALTSIDDLAVGDIVECEITFHGLNDTQNTRGEFRLVTTQHGGTAAEMTGSRALVNTLTVTGAENCHWPLAIRGIAVIGATSGPGGSTGAGTCVVYMQGRSNGTKAQMFAPFSFVARVWRMNS